MPSSYDNWLPFNTQESFNSGTGVGGGMPVFDTLALFDTPLNFDGFVKAFDRQTQPFDNAEFYDGVVPAYDAIRVMDGPSPYEWPPA